MYENQYQYDPNAVATNEIPNEIKRWNWGAFMFNYVWGIGHRTYLPLLVLIPFFNLVWVFICGAKGNQWAWKNGNYGSAEEFMKMQESWNRAGFVSFIITIAVLVVYFLFFASTLMGMFSMMNSGLYY